MSDRQSSLCRAASEPDLTSLPPAAPSPPTIPIPSPRPTNILRMFDDDEPFPISFSPRRTPNQTPPRSPSPQPSPSPTYQQPPSAVSFSEYVASELARHASLGVHFAAAEERQPQSPTVPGPSFEHDLPDLLHLDRTELHADVVRSEIVRSETVPDLTTDFDPSPCPTPPDHPTIGELVFASATKGRYGKLHCIQIDIKGQVAERDLTRADILNEARANFSDAQPSPTAVGRWLTDTNLPADVDKFTQMIPGAGKSRKAAHKAMRDYLRNSLQARDIRQVDPAFVAKPALWVRHSALVVSLEGLRAIILHDKMFLFDRGTEKTQHLLFIAKQSILARPDAEDPQPFEFKALEGILIFLAMGLDREFEILKPAIDVYLHQLPNELTTKMLEELRVRKQLLNHFHSRASNIKNILENLLDEDEDMANMYLTEKHASQNYVRSSGDHSEIETLLEAYLQVIAEHVNQSTLLNDAIDDTEDLVSIHLDTLRNRLLAVELACSVVSMAVGAGGLIASMFGMNLPIAWFDPEATQASFFIVVGIIVALIAMGSWVALAFLPRKGFYSFTRE